MLERLLRAGVDVVRLNFSHGKAQDPSTARTGARSSPQRVGKPVASIKPTCRGRRSASASSPTGKVMLAARAAFMLDAARSEPGDIDAVGLDYKELPRDVAGRHCCCSTTA